MKRSTGSSFLYLKVFACQTIFLLYKSSIVFRSEYCFHKHDIMFNKSVNKDFKGLRQVNQNFKFQRCEPWVFSMSAHCFSILTKLSYKDHQVSFIYMILTPQAFQRIILWVFWRIEHKDTIFQSIVKVTFCLFEGSKCFIVFGLIPVRKYKVYIFFSKLDLTSFP